MKKPRVDHEAWARFEEIRTSNAEKAKRYAKWGWAAWIFSIVWSLVSLWIIEATGLWKANGWDAIPAFVMCFMICLGPITWAFRRAGGDQGVGGCESRRLTERLMRNLNRQVKYEARKRKPRP